MYNTTYMGSIKEPEKEEKSVTSFSSSDVTPLHYKPKRGKRGRGMKRLCSRHKRQERTIHIKRWIWTELKHLSPFSDRASS